MREKNPKNRGLSSRSLNFWERMGGSEPKRESLEWQRNAESLILLYKINKSKKYFFLIHRKIKSEPDKKEFPINLITKKYKIWANFFQPMICFGHRRNGVVSQGVFGLVFLFWRWLDNDFLAEISWLEIPHAIYKDVV